MAEARIIEVECDTIEQVGEACEVGVDIVLLDNMTPRPGAGKAVEIVRRRRQDRDVRAASRLDAVGAYAESGADFISVGALTHSVRVFDIGLDIG